METVVLKERDSSSIEVKARYLIDGRHDKRNDYRLSLYFFFPHSFAITGHTYDPSTFFSQTKAYLRFNTPSFSVEELLNEESPASPLTRIAGLVRTRMHGDGDIDRNLFEREAKMLGSVYKSLLRDFTLQHRPLIAAGDMSEPEWAELKERIALLGRPSERVHELCEYLHEVGHQETEEILSLAKLTDEHMSLLMEKYFSALLVDIQEHTDDKLAKLMTRMIAREEKYRSRQGYPSCLPEEPDEREKEEYVYRQKVLKNYSRSALFFHAERRNVRQRIEHFLYALAAGLAMAVATSIAFFGQTWFGSLTTSLFVVLVIGYMIKDRIKESVRDMLRRKVARRMSDRLSVVHDPKGHRKIARITERASFARPRKLPAQVHNLRDRGRFEQLLDDEREEHVLLYEKRARVSAKRVAQYHHRIDGLVDIDIINLDPFLRALSTQSGMLPIVTGKKHLHFEKVQRIYHLNLIVAWEHGDTQLARRFRLVVDRGGIKRIEPVSTGDTTRDERIRFVGRGAATVDEDLWDE